MIPLLIYVLGCPPAYLLFRKVFKQQTKSWTVGDRKIAIFLSLLSWFSVLASLFILALEDMVNGDGRPASW